MSGHAKQRLDCRRGLGAKPIHVGQRWPIVMKGVSGANNLDDRVCMLGAGDRRVAAGASQHCGMAAEHSAGTAW